MPYGQLIRTVHSQYAELEERLHAEWEVPGSDANAPVIIETTDTLRPQQAPTHLYVFWKSWEVLTQRERSEMMMEVYEAVRGRSAALNVTVAMGLTPQEADNLGIRYESEKSPQPA